MFVTDSSLGILKECPSHFASACAILCPSIVGASSATTTSKDLTFFAWTSTVSDSKGKEKRRERQLPVRSMLVLTHVAIEDKKRMYWHSKMKEANQKEQKNKAHRHNKASTQQFVRVGAGTTKLGGGNSSQ